MAGPCCSIHLKNFSWEKDAPEVATILSKYGELSHIDSVMIDGHFMSDLSSPGSRNELFPLSVYKGDAEFFDEHERKFLKELPNLDAIGFHICVHTSGMPSGRLLANIALLLLNKWDGLIDFNGELELGNTEYRGKLYSVPYQIDDDRMGFGHFGDRQFLKEWMRSKHFYMIK